jgi:hypothetical protein
MFIPLSHFDKYFGPPTGKNTTFTAHNPYLKLSVKDFMIDGVFFKIIKNILENDKCDFKKNDKRV